MRYVTSTMSGLLLCVLLVGATGALADAGKNGRPILLDFYTDW